MFRNRGKGFTLIELMPVVAVECNSAFSISGDGNGTVGAVVDISSTSILETGDCRKAEFKD